MKKTVILILIFLPIVLLLVIAIAGRVLSTYQRIDVERVVFIDNLGDEMADDAYITLGVGDKKPTKIKIYPELATDKRVNYSSTDETVCTVDENGVVDGIGPGYATIMVKTVDGDKTDKLDVIVRADKVTGVTLTPETLSMMIGDSKDLQAIVEPFAAINKRVTYTTSDPSVVTVSATGKLKAVGTGTAIVTVTTEDGGFTDTCTVTVSGEFPPLKLDFTGIDSITYTGTGYISSQISVNLMDGLKVSGEIDVNDVKFLVQGDDATVDENGVLTFSHQGIVVVVAYVGNENDPICSPEIRIAYVG